MTELMQERYELAKERIQALAKEDRFLENKAKIWFEFFEFEAQFLGNVVQAMDYMQECADKQKENVYRSDKEYDFEKYKQWNKLFYEEILPENYEYSYTNPDYTEELFGKENQLGTLISAIAAEMRVVIPYAYELNYDEVIIRMELLLELYTSVVDSFEEYQRAPQYEILKDIIYWYASDYSETESLQRVKEMVDAGEDFAYGIVLDSDLSNPDYLYKYGEYITENEIQLSKYIASLPEETIHLIADTFTEGYRIGFVNTGKDLTKKTSVNIRYPLGFERVIRQAIRNFELLGLKCVIYRAGSSFFRRQGTSKVGYFGANPNKQYDYDHKEDEAIFFDGQFVTRKLECLKAAFEEYKEFANGHAGPAVMEVFGEQPFTPVVKESAFHLTKQQQKLSVRYAMNAGQITNEYIKGEERSFTIIAFPVPEIGSKFEEIFAETIKINTLDYKKYQTIQQTIIDALDQAVQVHVLGKDKNVTDITVAMHGISDAMRQTQFENCVADVNIPVGEVFTSPKLTGTTGTIHVSRVYLNDLEYKNLKVRLEDGMVKDYSCDNFEKIEDNLKYFKDNVLYHHESLPLGEFAIGTNTTAYVMARKYGIEGQLPILIAEKTGPHFALGDTCYSHAEDVKVYNPNGKEIIARDNEVSILRKTDMDKAYFNCHTDITIPYDELALIEAIKADGNTIKFLENGRFVLPGTEELNQAFEQ